MTRSNRGWNRIVLLLAGLAWLVAGATLIARQIWPEQASAAWNAGPQAVADGWDALVTQLGLPLGSLDPAALWPIVLVAAAVIVLAWAIVHAATRGRGRTSEAAEADDVIVDVAAVEDVFEQAFGAHADVLKVTVSAWGRRTATAWRATVHVRQHARLDEIADQAEAAARQTRERIGIDAPFVIHLAGGLRASVAGASSRAA